MSEQSTEQSPEGKRTDEPPIYRRCKRRHLQCPANLMVDQGRERCAPCREIEHRARDARKGKRPMCPEGHGLIGRGVKDGKCTACNPEPPAPPHDWLDWAQVVQAISGEPLVRELTRYELLTAMVTVIWQRETTIGGAASWLRKHTNVSVPKDDGQYLFEKWAPEAGLPVITVDGAIGYENPPDLLIADYAGDLDELGRPYDDGFTDLDVDFWSEAA